MSAEDGKIDFEEFFQMMRGAEAWQHLYGGTRSPFDDKKLNEIES